MLFSFPHDPVRREKWVSAMGRYGWTPSVHASLCSIHFEDKCFDRTGQIIRLRDGSIPTLFVPRVHVSIKFYVTVSLTFYADPVALKLFYYTKYLLSFNFLRIMYDFFALINMYRLLCLRHTVRHVGIHIICWLFFPVFRKGGITKQFLVEILYVIF